MIFKYLVIEDDTNVWDNIKQRMDAFPNWQALPFSAEITDAKIKLEGFQPDLIFMDWSIKGGNAFEILELIKNTADYAPYIIFFTGYQSERPEIPERIFNHFSIVSKYLIKPIYENLSLHLNQYVKEAEKNALEKPNAEKKVWIEDYLFSMHLIDPNECICILSESKQPRLKRLFFLDRKEIIIKKTWSEISDFLKTHGYTFFVTHHRKSMVNTLHIQKICANKVSLPNDIIVEVSRKQSSAMFKMLDMFA